MYIRITSDFQWALWKPDVLSQTLSSSKWLQIPAQTTQCSKVNSYNGKRKIIVWWQI